jgi:putative MATE family efflux protein
MLVACLANVVNIAGNWLLIGGNLGAPALGVLGAALSSAASLAIQATLLGSLLLRGRVRLRVTAQNIFQPARAQLAAVLRISGPSFLEQLIFHAGFLTFSIVVGRLGTVAMAANQAAISIESICFLSSDAFGIAAAALVGQRLGARAPEEATRAGRSATRMCALAMLAASIIFLFFAEHALWLFTDDRAAIDLGALSIRVGILELPFLGAAIVLARALRGAGATLGPLLVTGIGVWGFRVPAAWILGLELGFGLPGIWVATLLDWLFRAIALMLLWKLGRWRQARV